MNRPAVIKFLSGLLHILVCLIAITVILYLQDWFGKGDTYSFIFWTVPLAAGIAVSGLAMLGLVRISNIFTRISFIALVAVLLSIGWALCVSFVLGPVIGAFSVPILYLWTIGSFVQLLFLFRLPVQASRQELSIALKGLLILPVTLVAATVSIFLLSFLGSYLTRPEKETYLIPSDFEGEFRVVYGEECGINPPIENGRRVLTIPENGVLIIQPEFEAGIIDHEYYFVDKNGKREKVRMLLDYNEQVKNSHGVLLGPSGSMAGEMPDGSSSSESPLAIHFTDFTVFNKDTVRRSERDEFKFQQRFDSLTTALVDECRKKKSL
ncbi:hypothetical protein I2I11_21140 [Pontibacter sp. 172403-2]|uniref:DUF6843 domain-containing protein n=1 Tax=Pontibacter rufus TaxID=2791028 RepID=UPI0018AFBD38|nr:hypothetical protein [Pontibacter sp. 172403-2]MBF9255818.1 hypothetical protein [Pontibacter sp. 172403-2]